MRPFLFSKTDDRPCLLTSLLRQVMLMQNHHQTELTIMKGFILSLFLLISLDAFAKKAASCPLEKVNLRVGDIVFIEATNYVFQRVSVAQGGWMNHAGIVVREKGELVVAESTIPWVRTASLCKFNNKSKDQRFEVKRVYRELMMSEEKGLYLLAKDMKRTLYDLGFDFTSNRMYCSKFVRYLVKEIMGVELGTRQKLEELYKDQDDSEITFWTVWYGGKIPWERITVTPKSLYDDSQLEVVASYPIK